MSDQLDVYNEFKNSEHFNVTVRTPGDTGTYNNDTNQYDGATPPIDDRTFGIKKNKNIRDAEGTIIQKNVSVLLIPAYRIPELNNNHLILIDDVVQEISNIIVVDPLNIPLMYEVYLG